jgi:hypothetical protein
MSNFMDTLVTAIMFIGFAFAIFVSYIIFSSLNSSGALGVYGADMKNFYVALNNMAAFIAVGLAVGAIAAAYLIRANPIFLGISIILIAIQWLILPNIVTAMNGFFSNPTYALQAADMSLLITVVQYIPIFSTVGALLAAVIGIMSEAM